MSAALKSYVPLPVPPRRRSATDHAPVALSDGSTAIAVESSKVAAPVVLPTAVPGPAVQILSKLHLVSSVLAAAVVALTLVSYGTSVYLNRQLGQASQQLNRLQRSEQQIAAANEVLKNHLAKQIEDSSFRFQSPHPGKRDFFAADGSNRSSA
jgi:alpha-D-ribose 1-methylphosphonate 5-triphosphate synthase subunit PhnH